MKHMMKIVVRITLLVFAISSTAMADMIDEQDNCKTKPADRITGERKTCNIRVCIEAPAGKKIRKSTVDADELDHRGTGSGCETDPDNFEYVYEDDGDGPAFLKKVCATGNARSHSRGHGGTGRVECKLKGETKGRR